MSAISLIEHTVRHAIDFKSRAGRAEYWYWIFFTVLMLSGIYFIGQTVPILSQIWIVWFVVATLVDISLTVRRLHDLDLSGKWFLLVPAAFVLTMAMASIAPGFMSHILFVPVVLMIIFYFIVGFVPGEAGENQFGAPFPPRAPRFE